MTTPVVIQVQTSVNNVYGMVAEQGVIGLTFRHVPTINDEVVSASNPIPVVNNSVSASTIAITTSLNNLSTALTNMFSTLTASINSAISSIPT